MKPDKLTMKILKFMIPNGAGYSCSISTEWDNESNASISQLCNAVNAGEPEVLEAISYMVKHGLAEYQSLRSKLGPVCIAFHLTHEGLHFKEFASMTNREKWKQRLYGFLAALLLWGAEELFKFLTGLLQPK